MKHGRQQLIGSVLHYVITISTLGQELEEGALAKGGTAIVSFAVSC